MFAEVIAGAYDFNGKKVFKPSKRRHKIFHPTFPMGLFVRSELKVKCNSIREIGEFLRKCRYVSDKKQFNRNDYWMPPNEFEKKRKGDCEDFALWTWRQLMDMGFRCRFIVGYSGKYGEGHSWLTAEKDDKKYLVEPLASGIGQKLPRLSFIRHVPEISVEWDGKKLHYFEHKPKQWRPSLVEVIVLVPEWLVFYAIVILKIIVRLLFFPFLLIRKFLFRK